MTTPLEKIAEEKTGNYQSSLKKERSNQKTYLEKVDRNNQKSGSGTLSTQPLPPPPTLGSVTLVCDTLIQISHFRAKRVNIHRQG